MRKQTIITIWYDSKGKCVQIIKPSEKFESSGAASLVDSITCGNYYRYFVTLL